MGIYWYAYDNYHNKYFMSPTSYSGDSIIQPNNPFPQMIIMKNMRGYNFGLYNDVSWDIPDKSIDITNEVYKEYLDLFPWAEKYYEQKLREEFGGE